MPKIDIDKVPDRYIDRLSAAVQQDRPGPIAQATRQRRRADQFGVNICTLKPGAASSQRHWQDHEDEFVYVLTGRSGAVRGRWRDGPEARRCRWLEGRRAERSLPRQSLTNATPSSSRVGTRAPNEKRDLSRHRHGVRARSERPANTPGNPASLTEETDDGQFQLRRRCRRHCADHLGHAGPLDERHRRFGDAGAVDAD